MLVDSHCHLDFPELNADLSGVLSRMRDNGVTHALTISTTLETFPAVHAVAQAHPNVWCSAGVHPDERRDGREVELDELVSMGSGERVVAIGETRLGVAVDATHDVVSLSPADYRPSPHSGGERDQYVAGVARIGGALVNLIDLAEMLREQTSG